MALFVLLLLLLSGSCFGALHIIKPGDDLFMAQKHRQEHHHFFQSSEENNPSEASENLDDEEVPEIFDDENKTASLFGSQKVGNLVKREDSSYDTSDPKSDPFELRDDITGRICLLAKFNFTLLVIGGKKHSELKPVSLPEKPRVTGFCRENDSKQKLQLSWGTITLTMTFKQKGDGHYWQIVRVKVEFKIKDPVFYSIQRTNTPGIIQNKVEEIPFQAEVGRMFTCDHDIQLDLYDNTKSRIAVANFADIYLQPYVGDAQSFGRERRCWRIRDETVPVAVGSTLAIITLLTIAAYAVFRHFKVSKVQYDTME